MTWLGLSIGHETVREAEHWLHGIVRRLDLAADGLFACTHLVQVPRPHVAVSLAFSGLLDGIALPAVPVELIEAAARARAEHTARRSGRAVVYPGVTRLTGTLTIAELHTRSAIDRVTVMGNGPPAPGALVDTRGFVRPQWMDGLLTLVTAPAGDGRLAPFEVPNPTPCCADHA